MINVFVSVEKEDSHGLTGGGQGGYHSHRNKEDTRNDRLGMCLFVYHGNNASESGTRMKVMDLNEWGIDYSQDIIKRERERERKKKKKEK